MRYIKRAFSDTFDFLGGWGLLASIIAIPLVGLGIHWLIHGWQSMMPEFQIWLIYGLGATAAVFIAILLWNLACAPYRIERDLHEQTRKELKKLRAVSGGPVNWSAWKQREQFTVKEAAFLMAGIEPGEGGLRGDAYAYAQDIKWAIGDGALTSITSRAIQTNRRFAASMGHSLDIPDSEVVRAGTLRNWLVEHEHSAAKEFLANLDEFDLLRLLSSTE